MEIETPFLRVKVSSIAVICVLIVYLADPEFAARARQVVLIAEEVLEESWWGLWKRVQSVFFAGPLLWVWSEFW
jgi:hypothetical protein